MQPLLLKERVTVSGHVNIDGEMESRFSSSNGTLCDYFDDSVFAADSELVRADDGGLGGIIV